MVGIKDFQKDMECYLLSRKGKEPACYTVKVQSAGRKYVKVIDLCEKRFEERGMNFLVTVDTFGEYLFLTKEEAMEFLESDQIARQIHDIEFYKLRNCSLKHLKEIQRILQEGGCF